MMRRGVVAGAAAWAAALPLATFAASQPHPSVTAYLFSLAVYAIGSVVCHQIDTRSFHLWGHQMPVCARCTGIYLGASVAALVAASSRRRTAVGFAVGSRVRPFTVVVAAALPMLASLLFEWTTATTPPNVVRAATGAIAGGAAAWVVVAGLATASERHAVVN